MHVMLCITAPFSALRLLEELLPLGDTRRAEITVFLEFATAARTDPPWPGPVARSVGWPLLLRKVTLEGSPSGGGRGVVHVGRVRQRGADGGCPTR